MYWIQHLFTHIAILTCSKSARRREWKTLNLFLCAGDMYLNMEGLMKRIEGLKEWRIEEISTYTCYLNGYVLK